MSILLSLIKKETLHILRDRRTMLITLLMPVVLLLLFGFAISTEVNNVRIAAVNERPTPSSRELLQRFATNEYFTFQGIITPGDAESLLRSGATDVVLFIRNENARLRCQIMVDASNPTLAQAMTGYVRGIMADADAQSPVVTHTLYNPQLKSSFNFVPGILGMIFILICAIMTSVSIVREKETGTMNLLLVSPIRPAAIIIGKLVPYFILSCLILTAMLIMAYTLLGLPFSASVINVVGITLLYIVLSLSIGLLVSTLVETQLTALIVSAVMFMLPIIMLSGMIFPIDNMPAVLRGISCVIPARWYIAAMRKLMVQQLDFSYIIEELSILIAMTVVFILLAVKKFQSSTR